MAIARLKIFCVDVGMDECEIVPTSDQLRELAGPATISSLKVADFLGRQDYINWWIVDWLDRNDISPDDLPLCVSETLICFPEIKKHYCKRVRVAARRNDEKWVENHFIVPFDAWGMVRFNNISDKLFDILWKAAPHPEKFSCFIVESRRLYLLERVIDTYGPQSVLEDCVAQLWYEGADLCIISGANVKEADVISKSMLSPRLFKLLIECGAVATPRDYVNFKIQRTMKRLPDVALVEEWLWTQGFRDE